MLASVCIGTSDVSAAGKPASYGNGTQLIFQASTPAQVDEFYQGALELGGQDEGPPGPRNYRPGYYGAYCRDQDGNKLHVFHLPDKGDS